MMTTTNQMQVVDPLSGKPRHERRRDEADARRQTRYAKSGFVDRSAYSPFVPTPQHAGKDRFTPEQLHERAVQRQTRLHLMFKAAASVVSKNELVRMFDDRAPHANRATAEHKHFDRAPARKRARAAYEAGLKETQPIEHMHSAARLRMQGAPQLAMAA